MNSVDVLFELLSVRLALSTDVRNAKFFLGFFRLGHSKVRIVGTCQSHRKLLANIWRNRYPYVPRSAAKILFGHDLARGDRVFVATASLSAFSQIRTPSLVCVVHRDEGSLVFECKTFIARSHDNVTHDSIFGSDTLPKLITLQFSKSLKRNPCQCRKDEESPPSSNPRRQRRFSPALT